MVNELLAEALDAESASSFQRRYRPVSYCLTGQVRALWTAPAGLRDDEDVLREQFSLGQRLTRWAGTQGLC